MTATIFDKSPITKQLERAQRELAKYHRQEEEAASLKPKFNFGRWFERNLTEIAVHIPVGVAIGISCYGWEQYGAFAFGLVPLTCALSYLLSRTYSMALTTHRLDVAGFLIILGGLAFCTEAYGVHLGLERFNHHNEVSGLQTFDDAILILVSVMLGLMNLFSRRAFVTGHDPATIEAGRPEAWWKWAKRRDKVIENIGRTSQAPRLKDISDEEAVRCFEKNGGWPLGYRPTPRALQMVGAQISTAA